MLNVAHLGGAFESFGRILAAVDKGIEGDGEDEVDVEELELDRGAKAECGVEVGQAL